MSHNVEEAIRLLQQDLDSTLGSNAARLKLRSDPGSIPKIDLVLHDQAIGTFRPLRNEEPADVIQVLADEVQHDLIAELGKAWPVCPLEDHHHPLLAETENGKAAWICPADQSIVSPIGQLMSEV